MAVCDDVAEVFLPHYDPGYMDLSKIEFMNSSRARCLRLAIRRDGHVRVTIPRQGSRRDAEAFVEAKRGWIERVLKRIRQRDVQRLPAIPPAELPERRREVLERIQGRLDAFASAYGVTYKRITIKQIKTRWGSCSSRGFLNFNVKLGDLPEELIDYILVHEVCHLREMNHSSRFWALVEKQIPAYRERRRVLRTKYALE